MTKIISKRLLGRYINPATGRSVNVRKGRKAGYGVDVLFYLRNYKMVFIDDRDFYGKWKEATKANERQALNACKPACRTCNGTEEVNAYLEDGRVIPVSCPDCDRKRSNKRSTDC